MKKVISFLRNYNLWRKGGGTKQPSPKAIGIMIDKAVRLLELLDKFNGLPTKVYIVVFENSDFDMDMSWHNTLEGAYKKRKEFMLTDYMDWYNTRIQWGKDRGRKFGVNQLYYIKKVKVEK